MRGFFIYATRNATQSIGKREFMPFLGDRLQVQVLSLGPRQSKLCIACSFFAKIRARSRRCFSSPQKVTLSSPAQLQAPSRRFAVATNFLRVQIHRPKMGWHLFCYVLTVESLDTQFAFGALFMVLYLRL